MYQRCRGRRGSGAAGRRGGGYARRARPRPNRTRPPRRAAGNGRHIRRADAPIRCPAAPLPRRPRFRVQIAAVATPGAADDAASKAEKLGFSTVILRERGLYKVRAGEFATRQEAQGAVAKLKAGVGGSPFVVAEK